MRESDTFRTKNIEEKSSRTVEKKITVKNVAYLYAQVGGLFLRCCVISHTTFSESIDDECYSKSIKKID